VVLQAAGVFGEGELRTRASIHLLQGRRGVVPLAAIPVAALLGHHVLEVFRVAFGVMFLVSLAAFLLHIFTLPSDRGGGG